MSIAMTKILSYVVITTFVLVTGAAEHACTQRNKKIEEQLDIVTTATSPSQEYVATLYIVSGGGAGGYAYKVINLRKRGERFDPKKGVIFSVTGTRDVTLSWDGNDHLLVKYSKLGNIYAQAKEWGRVRISYLGTD
jgi:hypothetical protein